MQRWKRLLATGTVASVALLGAACEVEDDPDGTTVIDEEDDPDVVNEGDDVDVTEQETTIEDGGDDTSTEGDS